MAQAKTAAEVAGCQVALAAQVAQAATMEKRVAQVVLVPMDMALAVATGRRQT